MAAGMYNTFPEAGAVSSDCHKKSPSMILTLKVPGERLDTQSGIQVDEGQCERVGTDVVS